MSTYHHQALASAQAAQRAAHARAQANRLPPTPPEYSSAYMTPMSAVSDEGYYSSHSHHGRHTSSRDHHDRYNAAYAVQRSNSHMLPGYQVMPQFYQAPMLPPIRSVDPIESYVPTYVQEPKKEEKPTGGVAQHLDYEMDLMSSFVAEMSQNLVNRGVSPSSQFRKYVSQILSSTRLPSSTIMLGLFYLSARMEIVDDEGIDVSSSGTVYRMLTTCLLLGSKFLDDNTFQNRSWAEVSSIPVQELNTMELAWLQGFNWEIHNMFHRNGDLDKWIASWHAYEKSAQVAKAEKLQRLAPLDTSIRRAHSVHQPIIMSPDGPIPPQYQSGPQYDTQWARPYLSEYSPPSAPHSGPATPEYYSSWSYGQTPASFSRYSGSSAYASQQAYSQTPSYQPYSYQTAWNGHGPSCGCSLCAKHPEYYFTHNGYGMQTVVG